MKSQKGLSTVKYSRQWDIPIIKLKYTIIRLCTIFKKGCAHSKQRHFECDLLKNDQNVSKNAVILRSRNDTQCERN